MLNNYRYHSIFSNVLPLLNYRNIFALFTLLRVGTWYLFSEITSNFSLYVNCCCLVWQEYIGFVKAMNALRGMKLCYQDRDTTKAWTANIRVMRPLPVPYLLTFLHLFSFF